MTNQPHEELLACPFCGSGDVEVRAVNDAVWRNAAQVACNNSEPPSPSKNAPTQHHGGPITDVRPFFYAHPQAEGESTDQGGAG